MLIAGQVTLALVLLVGSALMLQSLVRLAAVDPGFKVDGVLTSGVSLGREADRARVATFYHRVLDEVAALPVVVSVGAGSSLPIAATSMNGSSFDIESRPRAEGQIPPVTMYHAVMAGYFETLGIPLVEGRAPERVDADQPRAVVWVNQTFARQFLEGRALGERIRIGDDKTWLEIAGVVGDVRTFGLREDIRPMAYLPLSTSSRTSASTSCRSSWAPSARRRRWRRSCDRRSIASIRPCRSPPHGRWKRSSARRWRGCRSR
jgi:hypothetical protein